MSALDSVTDVLEGPQQVLGQSSGQVVRISAGQESEIEESGDAVLSSILVYPCSSWQCSTRPSEHAQPAVTR